MNVDLSNLPLRYIATLIAAIELVVVLYIILVYSSQESRC